jgi:peptidoglycan/LPS O-acetylase OafA/YrhL
MREVKLPYRPHIDGLRAVAVLSVLGFHAFPHSIPAGFVGVDLFFVISGFLISGILFAEFGSAGSRGLAVIGRFYGRRIRRIFPSLLVVLAAGYAIGYATLLPNELAKLGSAGVAAAGFCLNLVLAQTTGYFATDALSQPLLHLWSLGVEEQFYLVWPLIIWAATRVRGRLLPITLFLATASFVWAIDKPKTVAAAAFFLPQYRLWELLIGSLAALAVRHRTARAPRALWRENLTAVLGWALIVAGFLWIRSESEVPNAWILLPTVGAAFVVTSDGRAWIHRRIVASPILVWLGLISYPLYLWHWPLLTFGRLASANGDGPGAKLLAMGGSIVLAWWTYVLVERPLRNPRQGKAKIGALGAAMTALAVVGLLLDRADGYPARFPPVIQALARFKYEPAVVWREGSYFITDRTPGIRFKQDPNEIDPRKPSLVLWGDSHAAGLYPGVQAVFSQHYNIVQRTIAGQPPYIGSASRSPGDEPTLTEEVVDTIRRIRPQVVMIEANWVLFGWKPIEQTIERLKADGVRHIVLVGPVPQWNGSLPQQVCNYMRQHRSAPIPMRLSTGLRPEPLEIDAAMRAMSARLGVQYISPCEILHDRDGYLVRLGDTPESFTAWDYGHLTAAGSVYLVSHFPMIE